MEAQSEQASARASRVADAATVALAVGVAAAILAVAMAAGGAAVAAFESWFRLGEARSYAAGEQASLQTAQLAVSLFAFQVVSIALTLFAMRVWPLTTDPLTGANDGMPGQRWRFGLAAISALLGLAGLYACAIFFIDRRALAADVLPLLELVRTDSGWLIAIAAMIGAPVAEELLFRGFLHERLRRTALRATGTAVVTAIGWASLHYSYTVYGLVAIFLIGLYLAWLRERSGGLFMPIAAHAIYNAGIMAVLLTMPDHWLTTLGGIP